MSDLFSRNVNFSSLINDLKLAIANWPTVKSFPKMFHQFALQSRKNAVTFEQFANILLW